MEAILKESQGQFNTTEVNLTNYGHHSIKAMILAHAVSEGRFSDADYLASTFPVMVQSFLRPEPTPQPVILCLADTLADVKWGCVHALGVDEDSSVSVEALWAYNNLSGLDVRSLTLSDGNVRATLRILKARAGLDLLKVN